MMVRIAVGDRYVLELMKQDGLILGGETSGHIICLDRTSTGDGIIAALQVIAALSKLSCNLYEITSEVQKYPQTMINVKADTSAIQCKKTQQAVHDAEGELGSRGRVLLRPSGTEPVIRVMVEGDDANQVGRIAKDIATVIEEHG